MFANALRLRARLHWGAKPLASERRLFLSVRSVAAGSGWHDLQYALVDEAGEVRLNATTRTAGPVGSASGPFGPSRASADADDLEGALARQCFGARMVAFHRTLQAGLLPARVLDGSAGVCCAWRRFAQVARRRGLGLSRGEMLDLDHCLARAGLTPPTQDAAERAMALRALWLWMDANE